jgi:hypothetical protein
MSGISSTEKDDATFNQRKQTKQAQIQTQNSAANQTHREQSPFEQLLYIVAKVFNYFNLNELAVQASAPSTLTSSHHIYITDGLLYATDMIGFLERISKSSISFSFIYSGYNSMESGGHISSSFGHLPDQFLMLFLAKISKGFFALVDENLNYKEIYNRPILYFFPMLSSSSNFHSTLTHSFVNKSVDSKQKQANTGAIPIKTETLPTNASSKPIGIKSGHLKSQDQQSGVDAKSSHSCNSRSAAADLTNPSRENGQPPNATIRPTRRTNQIKRIIASVNNSESEEQRSELKCLLRYELLKKQRTLNELVRLRSQEGFYLVKVNKELVKSSPIVSSTSSQHQRKQRSASAASRCSHYMISLFFMRYFTQTTIFTYKLSYYITRREETSNNKPNLDYQVNANIDQEVAYSDQEENHQAYDNGENNMEDQKEEFENEMEEDVDAICDENEGEERTYNAKASPRVAQESNNSNEANEANEDEERGSNESSSSAAATGDDISANGARKKLSKSRFTKNIDKYFIELWISWNFLHMKAKYQNSVLINQIRRTIALVQTSDIDRTFDLTASMLKPPDILKLKEPLFKLLLLNEGSVTQKVLEQDQVSGGSGVSGGVGSGIGIGSASGSSNLATGLNQLNMQVFTMNNLSFQLNIRTNKREMEREFVEFARAWHHLAFWHHYSSSWLTRYFGMHSLKLILEHDKPMPEPANSVIFDIKNTTILININELGSSMQNAASSEQAELIGINGSGDYLYPPIGNRLAAAAFYGQLNRSNMINMCPYNIFNCHNSLSKLYVVLIEWCDIVLVENCVYLKFLSSSSEEIFSNEAPLIAATSKPNVPVSMPNNSDIGPGQSKTSGMISSSLSNQHSTSEASVPIIALDANESIRSDKIDENYIDSDSSPNDKRQHKGKANMPGSPIRASDEADILKSNKQNASSTTSASSGTIGSTMPSVGKFIKKHSDESPSKYHSADKDSFVLVRLEAQNVPCVALQFLFHSKISYLDRISLIEKLKEKLCGGLAFKTHSTSPSSSLSSVSAVSSASLVATSRSSSGISSLTSTQPLYNTGRASSTISKSTISGSSNACNALGSNNNSSASSLFVSIDDKSSSSSSSAAVDINEFCYLLNKPDLYETFKKALFFDYNLNAQLNKAAHRSTWLEKSNELTDAVRLLKKYGQLLNCMEQKRLKWTISKSFSHQVGLMLKETIIDTLVRTRLKEGFKCLFQSSKFAVFTLQFSMFDSGELSGLKINTNKNNTKSSDLNSGNRR